MASLVKKLISMDSFGETVAVNYKGDSTYKTLIGAFCTICLRGFVLAFTILAIIDLI